MDTENKAETATRETLADDLEDLGRRAREGKVQGVLMVALIATDDGGQGIESLNVAQSRADLHRLMGAYQDCLHVSLTKMSAEHGDWKKRHV